MGFIELLKVVLMVGFFQVINHFKAINPSIDVIKPVIRLCNNNLKFFCRYFALLLEDTF